jgi:hypothetical protein
MSITDELRAWWVRKFPIMDTKLHKDFTAIADRIDAEHEEAIQQVLMGEGGVPATDENMAEHGWVRLPKDADGEYIHVGDEMEWPTTGETFEVVGIGEGTLFYVESDDADHAEWTGASTKRHHHAPTVEDVLREFTDAILEWSGKSGTVAETGTWSDVAAEYIKRLTLAEEDA